MTYRVNSSSPLVALQLWQRRQHREAKGTYRASLAGFNPTRLEGDSDDRERSVDEDPTLHPSCSPRTSSHA
jgi:hypothetical protein